MTHVFIEDNDKQTIKMFTEEGFKIAPDLQSADIICFGGGSDVTPSLYNQNNISSDNNVHRDINCVYLYNFARVFKKMCVGICRGGQFLNVMNLGTMIQDYDGHLEDHTMITDTRDLIKVTSSHHQLMVPTDKAIQKGMSGDANECLVYDHQTEGRVDICYQPHPEWVKKGHECRVYFFNLINQYLKS